VLTIFTIVLNGMPYIKEHHAEFKKLKMPWKWRIVEGVSSPEKCTSHCKKVSGEWHNGFKSIDGTSEYLDSIACDNISVFRKDGEFAGKLEMVEKALEGVDDGVVMEIDSDEMWRAEQIEELYSVLIQQKEGTPMQFECNYFVAPKKVVITKTGFASQPYEWFRAWRWGKDIKFESHEPPMLNVRTPFIPRGMTGMMGLIFNHYAYTTPEQVKFKEQFYGWDGFYERWKELQETTGPVRLKRFIPYASENTVVDDIL